MSRDARHVVTPPPAVTLSAGVAAPRAVGRLLRAFAHGGRGLAIVLLRFPNLDSAGRHAAIARWSAGLLEAFGIRLVVSGPRPTPGSLLVANHVSWLDIAAIHAVAPEARFVAKAAIRRWPLASRLANAADTLYLERDRKRDALRVVGQVGEALAAGRSVAVFPEGTTSDGRVLLPFHPNLLQAAIVAGAPVQPIALRFSDATAEVSAAVEFVGRTTLWQSLWRVAAADSLVVRVDLLPMRSTAGAERRALARALQEAIGRRLAEG